MHRRSKRVLIGFGMVIGLLVAIYAVWLLRSTVKLRRAYADLQAAGRPMTAAKVIPEPIPESRNAARLYERAVTTLKELPAPKKDLLEYTGRLAYRSLSDDLDPNETIEFETLLAREEVGLSLSLFEEALQRPECRFDRDYKAGDLKTPFELHDLRRVAAIARAKACRQVRAGDGACAWDVVRAQLKVADHLASDPVMDSQFPRLSVIRDCCYTMQNLCVTAPLDAQSYRLVQERLQGLDTVEPLVRAIDAERLVRGEWFFSLSHDELYDVMHDDDVQDGGDRELDAFFRLMFRFATFRPSLVASHAAYLRGMHKAVEMFEGPYVPRDVGVRKEFNEALGRHFLAHWVCQMHDYFRQFHCEMVARLHMTRAGLGLLEYRREHGAFPERLDELKLEGLVDPFVEQPLHYRAEPGGFLVYSVGEDLQDNGGIPKERRRSDDPRQKVADHDLLWRYSDTEGSTTEDI